MEIRDEEGLTSTDRLVAAIFSASLCMGSGRHDPDDYLANYDEFLKRMSDRAFAKVEATLADVAAALNAEE
jgi:hypothetical protein